MTNKMNNIIRENFGLVLGCLIIPTGLIGSNVMRNTDNIYTTALIFIITLCIIFIFCTLGLILVNTSEKRKNKTE